MDVMEKAKNDKRLIDANKLIDFIDVGHLRHPGELCYSEVDVANILLHAPTVDAVPVSKLEELRDYLYAEDLIFMRGLAELNKLIANCSAKMELEE